MVMNILYHASVLKNWEDLKLKCELEWPNICAKDKPGCDLTTVIWKQSNHFFWQVNSSRIC